MRYKYHFGERYSTQLSDFLEENGISHKVTGKGFINNPIVTFDLWSNKSSTAYYLAELTKMNCKPLVFIEYSETDRMRASYLWLLPQKQKIEIINGEEAFEFGCEYVSIMGYNSYRHEKQTSIIAIAKEPNSQTKTVFWTGTTGFSELFADYRVYNAVSSAEIDGVGFQNVRLRNGAMSAKIYQMVAKNVIGRSNIELGHSETVIKCPVCGKEQYDIRSGDYQLHLNVSQEAMQSDFYTTERIFGGGIAFPLYVISQRFYRLLKENGLTGGAVFSPVIFTE